MIDTLSLPEHLRVQLAGEARKAFPNECCGLIEGTHDGKGANAIALHATKNIGRAPDRFEIDPADHIRLLKSLRGTGRDIVGCYHSHPNGSAEPSPRDSEGASEEAFVWLIQPVTADGAGDPAAFVYESSGFRPLSLSA